MWIEIVGWIGLCTLLLAYLCLARKIWTLDSVSYHLCNIIGATAIFINAYKNAAWPVATLECIWGVVAVRGLLSSL